MQLSPSIFAPHGLLNRLTQEWAPFRTQCSCFWWSKHRWELKQPLSFHLSIVCMDFCENLLHGLKLHVESRGTYCNQVQDALLLPQFTHCAALPPSLWITAFRALPRVPRQCLQPRIAALAAVAYCQSICRATWCTCVSTVVAAVMRRSIWAAWPYGVQVGQAVGLGCCSSRTL